MTSPLGHFRSKLKQQIENSSNRAIQLEACLRMSLDEFELYIKHAIPLCMEVYLHASCNNKEEGKLNNETEMPK